MAFVVRKEFFCNVRSDPFKMYLTVMIEIDIAPNGPPPCIGVISGSLSSEPRVHSVNVPVVPETVWTGISDYVSWEDVFRFDCGKVFRLHYECVPFGPDNLPDGVA